MEKRMGASNPVGFYSRFLCRQHAKGPFADCTLWNNHVSYYGRDRGNTFVEFFDWGYLKRIPKIIIFIILVALSIKPIRNIEPYYFDYTNQFLPKKYTIVDGWGYGGYQAAEYLKSLPDHQGFQVVADYYGTCVFFEGPCTMYSDKLRGKFDDQFKSGDINYVVLSAKGKNRFKFIDDFPYLMETKPVWELNIDGRPENFVRIISSKQE
jgi:hypothetical protein